MASINTVSNPADIVSVIPSWRRVSELADLAEIFEPGVQVCTWQRLIDPSITAYLNNLRDTGVSQAIETLTASDQPKLNGLPPAPGRAALADDVTLLGEIVRELHDCPAVGLRLARVGHAMCPGWHIDRVGIRLVCTYVGPGTEWPDDQDIDRTALRSDTRGPIDHIQAAAGEIVLLKGVLWQDNEGFGAVHRSPAIPADAELRTLITLDPLWRQ